MPGLNRRVRVDPGLCEGHALCVELAPEVFDLTADDIAICDAQPADELWEQIEAAMNACPRGAITIESEPSRSAQSRAERTTTP